MTTIRTDYQNHLLRQQASLAAPAQSAAVSFNQLLAQSLGSASPAPQTNLDAIFTEASQTYGVPLPLLLAVAKAESNFDPNARSSAGAMGVMQLMPQTARALGVSDPYDARQNIMGGAKYLAQMLQRFDNDPKLALAAYNAGAGNVQKYGGIPPFEETQSYVEKVLSLAGEDLSAGSFAADSGFELEDFLAEFTRDDYLLFIQMINAKLYQSQSSLL